MFSDLSEKVPYPVKFFDRVKAVQREHLFALTTFAELVTCTDREVLSDMRALVRDHVVILLQTSTSR